MVLGYEYLLMNKTFGGYSLPKEEILIIERLCKKVFVKWIVRTSFLNKNHYTFGFMPIHW